MPHDDSSTASCPFCGSDALLDGFIGSSDATAYFQPSHLKLVGQLLVGVQLERHKHARACRNCGRVWAQLDPRQLSRAWEKWRREGGA